MDGCPHISQEGASPSLAFEQRVKHDRSTVLIRRFHLDADSQDFEELAAFHAIWRARLDGERLPAWKDFAFEDFLGWHRQVALSDITREDPDPQFRICGTGVVEILGVDLTGKKLSHIGPEQGRGELLHHFEQIRDRKLIGFMAGLVAIPGREFMQFKVLELPLANAAGEVGQVLHAMVRPKRSSGAD